MTSTEHPNTPPTPVTPAAASGLRRQHETAQLGDAIAELAARIQAATCELLVMIHAFDEREGWGEGFTSCAHWLNWRTGLAMGAAREKVRVARALAALPEMSAAMGRGALSYSKVRALTRIATPSNEVRLLDFARCATAAHVERLVRAWRRVDRIEAAEDDRRRHAGRHLETWLDEDGMLVVRGRLSPEVGAVVQRALDAASDRLYREAADVDKPLNRTAVAGPQQEDQEPPSPGQRRADALGLLAESALAADLDRGTAGDRYQVVVHVDADVLGSDSDIQAGQANPAGQAALEDGIRASAETSRRIACDASRVVMRHDRQGTVLDVGRKTRTIPPAIRRALTNRDRRCRFPGCDSRHCDAHHVRHWADGGGTRLDNLVLLCRRHHRAVHEEGFTVELRDDGDAHFWWPDGRRLPAAPAAPWWTGRPLAPTDAELADADITIDAHTATPEWHGERLDLGWAIDVLRWPVSSGSRARDVPAGTSLSNESGE
jgi:5-methylcytosine-specific restriction endonuclease McrA